MYAACDVSSYWTNLLWANVLQVSITSYTLLYTGGVLLYMCMCVHVTLFVLTLPQIRGPAEHELIKPLLNHTPQCNCHPLSIYATLMCLSSSSCAVADSSLITHVP